MTDRPQPTIDEHGVGYCSTSDCPFHCVRLDHHCTYYDRHQLTSASDICLPWARGMVEWGGRNHDRLMQLAGELGVTRARLRKVQRAARRKLCRWDGSRWWLRDKPGDDNSWEWMACPRCYRALPESGECRCEEGR